MATCQNENGKLVGKNVVLEVADGCSDTVPAAGDWKSLAAGTSKTLDLAPNTTNSSADDANGWVEYLTTSADATIAFEGEIRKNDRLNEYGFGRFVKYFVDEVSAERQPTLWVRLTVGPIEITGYMVITALSTDGGTDDIATFSTEFHIADGTTVEVLLLDGTSGDGEDVAVSKVIVSPESAKLEAGSSQTLYVSFEPANATNKAGAWSSSDDSVVTVTASGRATAIAPGTATITFKADDGPTDACVVTVPEPAVIVTDVEIDPTAATLKVGETKSLSLNFTPANATDTGGTWSSDSESVATVNSKGVVSAVAVGSAVVKFVSDDGPQAASAITVEAADVAVTGVELSLASLDLTAGDTASLSVTYTPTNATNQTGSYESSNPDVVTVNDNGDVAAVAAGSATITFTATDGPKASVSVSVAAVVVPVESVAVTPETATVTAGETVSLSVSVLPANATNPAGAWSSLDESIATVDADGVVTGVVAGSVDVVYTTEDGPSDSCSVTVEAAVVPVTAVTVDPQSDTVTAGETKQLNVSFTPDDATSKTGAWSSSDEEIATVDADGLVTTLTAGDVVITFKATDGPTDVCNLTVDAPVVNAESVVIDPDTATITDGASDGSESVQLKAVFTPEDTTDQSGEWATSDDSIAIVDATGLVTPTSGTLGGNVTISFVSTDGDINASAAVSVNAAGTS